MFFKENTIILSISISRFGVKTNEHDGANAFHPSIIFHQILKMTILLFYMCMKWKYGDNYEKCEKGSQNTCKSNHVAVV